MNGHIYSPNDRTAVRFIDDAELAYVLLRYRQVHDFWHVLLALPTTILGELAQKVKPVFSLL
jgi:ubiquinone biosynthesis protein COQ4